jgi:pimeloyl-ACP methyl ester carboxylesterase
MFDRDPDRSGFQYQRAAVASMPDLTPRLGELHMPVAVIHGRDDAQIGPRGSERIAAHVPHAELHLYPGMGHEIAPALWDDFARIITRTATHTRIPQDVS